VAFAPDAGGFTPPDPRGMFAQRRLGRSGSAHFMCGTLRGACASRRVPSPLTVTIGASVAELGVNLVQIDLGQRHLVGRVVEIIFEQLEIAFVDFPH